MLLANFIQTPTMTAINISLLRCYLPCCWKIFSFKRCSTPWLQILILCMPIVVQNHLWAQIYWENNYLLVKVYSICWNLGFYVCLFFIFIFYEFFSHLITKEDNCSERTNFCQPASKIEDLFTYCINQYLQVLFITSFKVK